MKIKIFVSLFALSMTVAVFAQTWAPVGENIKSPWAEELNPAAPLPELQSSPAAPARSS